MRVDLLANLRTIIGLVIALGLAIFAKRYSDMKNRDVKNRRREVEIDKETVTDRNDDLPLDDLVHRENDSARRRGDS